MPAKAIWSRSPRSGWTVSEQELPILLLEIFYKVLWLIIVAYPLWSKGTLAGSPAEDITSTFSWVILPIVAVPWGYIFVNYIYGPKK